MIHCWQVFCLYQKVGKVNWRALFLNRRVYLVHSGFVPAPNLSFFNLLAFSEFEFCGSRSAKTKISKKDRFHSNGPYCKIPTENYPIRTLDLDWRIAFHIIKWIIYGPLEFASDTHTHLFRARVVQSTHWLADASFLFVTRATWTTLKWVLFALEYNFDS